MVVVAPIGIVYTWGRFQYQLLTTRHSYPLNTLDKTITLQIKVITTQINSETNKQTNKRVDASSFCSLPPPHAAPPSSSLHLLLAPHANPPLRPRIPTRGHRPRPLRNSSRPRFTSYSRSESDRVCWCWHINGCWNQSESTFEDIVVDVTRY